MAGFVKLLMILSMLCFVLAIVANLYTGPIMDVQAEGFSRACTNLALIAIGITLVWKKSLAK